MRFLDTLKIIIPFLALVIGWQSIVFSQVVVQGGNIDPSQLKSMIESRNKEQLKELTEKLNLTGDQVKKMEKLFDQNQKEQLKEIQEQLGKNMGGGGGSFQMKSTSREKLDKNIEKILTADQKKQYEEMKKEWKKSQGQPRIIQYQQ